MLRRLSPLLLLLPLLAGCSLLARGDDKPPYWVSIATTEANLRVGPSRSYRVAWVYRRKGLPLKVVREHEGWRLVRDAQGAQGWMVSALLSRDRAALVVGEHGTPMRDEPTDAARLKWTLEPGVVGRLGDCTQGWCQLTVGEKGGFVRSASLWGAGEP